MLNCSKNKNLHYYSVYGLSISSEIALPELINIKANQSDNFDVNITLGTIPKEIPDTCERGDGYQVSSNEMFFYVDDVAYYFISYGRKIIVQKDDNASEEDVKTFLLGSAFGALLIQREVLAIHGGTVVINGKGIIITGDTGTGKSTLTSAFRLKGYPFLADDISAVGKGIVNSTLVYPSYPQQRLCEDAVKKMGYTPNTLKLIDADRNKYSVSVLSDFMMSPIPLGSLFELKIGDVKKVQINRIDSSEKMIILLKNIYRAGFLSYTGLKENYFRSCINIARNVNFYRVIRPNNVYSIDNQIELILETLN